MNEANNVVGNGVNGTEGLERICFECHMEKLDMNDMKFVESYENDKYGTIEKWECTVCDMVDYWIADDQKWSRDYEALHDEISRAYGE